MDHLRNCKSASNCSKVDESCVCMGKTNWSENMARSSHDLGTMLSDEPMGHLVERHEEMQTQRAGKAIDSSSTSEALEGSLQDRMLYDENGS